MQFLSLEEANKLLQRKLKPEVITNNYKKVNKFQTLSNCKLTQANKEHFIEAMEINRKEVDNLIKVDEYRKRKIVGVTKRKSLKHFKL